MYPRLLDFDWPHTRENRPAGQMAVANNLSMSGLVANLSMGIDPIGNLGFDRLGQQSLGTFSENAAQHILSLGEWQDSCVNATIAHGGVLLCLVGNWVKRTFTPRVRRLFSFDHQQLSVIPLQLPVPPSQHWVACSYGG